MKLFTKDMGLRQKIEACEASYIWQMKQQGFIKERCRKDGTDPNDVNRFRESVQKQKEILRRLKKISPDHSWVRNI